jgi:hypothetical protein
MKIFFILCLMFTLSANALEVDEKLTVRIIKTSESRRTVMINRGTEDGLVEGDHAKFIVTAGVVARGVLIKLSPGRSVWSIYRLVNADFIVDDSVMSIKITPPVKLTSDQSKALIQEDTPTKATSGDSESLGIPLADGAQDLNSADSSQLTASVDDLKALDEEVVTLGEKTIEVFGIVNISGLSSNTKSASGNDEFSHSQNYHHIALGGELYAQREREWYSRFSLIGAVAFMKQDTSAYNGASATSDVNEFSLGVNWHPTKLPGRTHAFIPFLGVNYGMGSVKSSYTSGSEGLGVETNLNSTGGTQSYSIGFGFKYFVPRGFGARVLLDYYSRVESYKQDVNTDKFSKKVGGPRLMVGLSYRF